MVLFIDHDRKRLFFRNDHTLALRISRMVMAHQVPFDQKLPVHIIQFVQTKERGILEIDDRNLISLCETEENAPSPNHHLRAGHSGDFQSSNTNIRQDAKVFFRMDEATIEKNAHYLENVKNRLKPWAQMTDQDKKDLTALIDRLYPVPKV